jgi:hypothetical protein
LSLAGGTSSAPFYFKGFKAQTITLTPSNDVGLGSVATALTTNFSGLSLAFQTQPVANAVKGQVFQTQPVVRLLYAGNPVSGVVDTVTITPTTSFTCSNSIGGTVGGGTASALASGVATFTSLSFSNLTAGSQWVYFKASSDVGGLAACAAYTYIYDTLTLTPGSATVATGGAQTFNSNIGGGVPPLSLAVSTNGSQSHRCMPINTASDATLSCCDFQGIRNDGQASANVLSISKKKYRGAPLYCLGSLT